MPDKIIDLYTIHCPMCNELERILKQKGIAYTEHTDEDEMIDLGFDEVPVLIVNGNTMNASEAIRWAIGQ